MAAEANLSKPLYKIELYLLKVIPMVMAALCLANTTLFYFGIDATILTYMEGVSFLTLGFLYLSSYVFRFCAYHRMFLHYIDYSERAYRHDHEEPDYEDRMNGRYGYRRRMR